MTRYQDWEKRLHLFCSERMHLPNQTDFITGAVLAMTGQEDGDSGLEVSVKMAQRGDIVEFDSRLGIVSLDGMRALFPGPDGLERVKVLSCSRAWRV